MSIWSQRSMAALIAAVVIMLMVGLFNTPAKAQDAGADVTVTIIGSGKVASGVGWSDPISCPGDCTGNSMGGGFAQLFATPDSGWSAVGWGGLCSGPRRDLCVANFYKGGSVSMTFETPVPEIDVRGGPAVLWAPNGDTTPDPNNGTDFGLANVSGSAIEQTFSIWNSGTGPLTLNGTPLVSLSGANAADFTLVSPPAATVASDSVTTFVLRFDPSAVGERVATVTIANDDSDEAPYSFSIQGTGYDAITSGPSPVNYAESTDGDLKNDTVYVPCSVSGFSDEFVLGVGVNRWTGTVGVTGNGVNQNDMFRALLPAGAYIDRITYQRESWTGSLTGVVGISLTDAGSQTLLQTGGSGALYVYDTPSQNSILTLMVISDFNPEPINWTITVNVVGSVQGSSGPILTYESASPPQINISEGQLGQACGRFSDRERDAVTLLPAPLTAKPVLTETGPIQTFADAPANSSGRWQWSVTAVDGPGDSQDVVLQAIDNNPAGSSSSQLTFPLKVANVAPTVNKPTVTPDPANEIATVSAQATWSDPGVLDVATCKVDYGDGSAPVAGVANFNGGSGVCSGPAHTYADSGSYVITVTVTDKDAGVGSNSYTYVVNNLPPVMSSVANSGPVKENKNVVITANAIDPAGATDPLIYAFDCDNDAVYEKGPQPQKSASCTFSAFGTYAVNVQVSDDDGGVTTGSTLVTIVRNSAPVANNQSVSTDEDTSLETTLTASDANGDSLTYSVVKGPGNGKVSGTPPLVTYTANANFAGVDSFTFKANDGEADSQIATITVTVKAVNDAPIANDNSFTLDEDMPLSGSVAGNDSDIDGDTLTYALVTNVNHGALTLRPDGSFTYTPATDYHGSDTFTYRAGDGNGGTDTATANTTVSAVNDAPTVTNDAAATVEDAAVTITVMSNDNDSADGGLLNPASVTVLRGPTSGATGVNAANGTIIYTPTANFYGSDSFTYRVCDNGTPLPALCGSATVTLTVAIVTDDDDDADGVADSNDAFPLDANESVDTDGDGAGDNADSDDDNDGVADADDAFPLDANESVDTDGDGIGNNTDSDDDGDGTPDSNDAFRLDKNESVDTDSDGTGNNADLDDDGDGAADSDDAFPLDPAETVDTDKDGAGDNADSDDDGDGVDDASDAFPLAPAESLDTDNDGTGNNADLDDDGDGQSDADEVACNSDPINAASQSTDADGDNSPDCVDADDDADGVADMNDAFPLDAGESVDSDQDGAGDNADSDDDGDGQSDSDEVACSSDPLDTSSKSIDTDSDTSPDCADSDDDNDGITDSNDAFPLDHAESVDTDGDGTGNNADSDDDGDGQTDADESACQSDALAQTSKATDSDGDNSPDCVDNDDDGDGTDDSGDASPLDRAESVDTDQDGVGNNADPDDDNDGVEDSNDVFPLDRKESADTDQDGTGANADPDDDNDGVADAQPDNCPLIGNTDQANHDDDAGGDACDTDDDNDGLEDSNDAFPIDANESVDADGDGRGNNADSDDDNDGIADSEDAFPLDPTRSVDTDKDGIDNDADTDDDNDGVTDSSDALPLNPSESVDTDKDGTGDNADSDDDNDNVADSNDAFPLDSSESVDTDGDGTGDNADDDKDEDEEPNTQPDNCLVASNSDQANYSQANHGSDTLDDACDNVSAAIGNSVWFDQDNNGLHSEDEAGIGGVGIELYKVDSPQIATVDGTLVASTTTNSAGEYRFTNLESGDYYLVYTPPVGYGFTLHDVNDNSQERIDSDAVAPLVQLSVSDFDPVGAAGFNSDLAYTLHYTNTDPGKVATNIVITVAIPTGTTFVAASSDPAWHCPGVNAGNICSATIAALNAESFDSLAFVVNLKSSELEAPSMLELAVGLANGSPARTNIVTLVVGEENHFVSAGLIHTLVVTQKTPVPEGTTGLPGLQQPKQPRVLFLPAVQAQR